MDSVRKPTVANISAIHANIMKDKIDLHTVSEIKDTANENLEPSMRNKCKSEVDTYGVMKATADDSIATASNHKYEQEIKLSSLSGPTSVNHPLLVEEMEVPNGRIARASESDNLSKDDELSVKDIRVDEGMPSEDKLLVYSDHNTCVEKVLTVMNDGYSGSLENRECKMGSQSSSALDVNRLTKDAVPCCQLNNNSGKEAFILGFSNLDDKSSPNSLKVNKEAKWNGIGHPIDECSNCALSQKNGDMYSTNTFQSQIIHQAEPECSSAASESQSASSTGSVTDHAVSVHVSEVTSSLNKVGMTLNTSADDILISPSSGQKVPAEQTAESEVDGKKSVAELDSDKTSTLADLSTSDNSVGSNIYTSRVVDSGAIKDVENHGHRIFGNPVFAEDIAGQTRSLEMAWNVSTQSGNEVMPVASDKLSGDNNVAEMVNHANSAPILLSGSMSYSGSISCPGSVSLRSDSSATSTRSFAFPILSNEWNSSPVKMTQADSRYYKKKQWWRCCCFCG